MSNTDYGPPDDLGSLAEEAGKLFGALSGWAREHAGEAGEELSDLAAQAAESAHDINEHLATGSAECTVCPICRGVHAVRQLSPEVRTHLASALSSLVHAIAGVMTTAAAEDTSGEPNRESEVQTINLNDDDWPQDGV